ncbi:hypothetical protein HUG17_6026 [Dermatophagoides farinae]|uniref:Uncharacterized protein n=1 Tax=Dermatophagoides farinae TaxID=6954 RepID=A0A9D4P3F1_DERFA|nr:hypothetical protein HUG17_6026 [Dermatophagoides farinae]
MESSSPMAKMLIFVFILFINANASVHSTPIVLTEKMNPSNNSSVFVTTESTIRVSPSTTRQQPQIITTKINNNNNKNESNNRLNLNANPSNVYRFDLLENGGKINLHQLSSSISKKNMAKRIIFNGNDVVQPQSHQILTNGNNNNKIYHGTKSITTSTTTTTTTNTNQNEDKNWLLTKAWLIDNINRLRRDLNELQRDYSKHVDIVHGDNLNNQKQLIEDVARIRADHQFLSQQQKQIIYLIKRSHYFKTKSNDLKLKIKMANGVPVQQYQSSSLNNKATWMDVTTIKSTKRPIMKRDIRTTINNQKHDDDDDHHHHRQSQLQPQQQQQQLIGEKFETETRRNMKEIFSELSSLHDISLILFDDLKTLERKMDIRDKLFT